MNSNEPDSFQNIIHTKSNGVYPLGFYLVRKIVSKEKKNKNLVLFSKSDFYQTDSFTVGKKDKPIAFILKRGFENEK